MLKKITIAASASSFFFGFLNSNRIDLPFFLKQKFFFVFVDSLSLQKKLLQVPSTLRVKMLTKQSILLFFLNFDKKSTRLFFQKFLAFLENQVFVLQQNYLFKVFLRGIGYKIEIVGTFLKFSIGFSHAIFIPMLVGLSVKFLDAQNLLVFGFNKQALGQFAAAISFIKKPNFYKNKGFFFINLAKTKITKSLLFKTNFQKKIK
jgi:ribosomal protein L6P/L9E